MARTVLAATVVLIGCSAGPQSLPDASGDVLPDADWQSPTDSVDLLFMIANSDDMSEEQALVAQAIRRLLTSLTSGDRDGDGVQDVPPLRSLHVGIVSSDLGLVPGATSFHCNDRGDDGVLVAQSMPIGTCEVAFPSAIFSFRAEAPNLEALVHDVACVATLGTRGCGFPQQLEAVLKAVAPAPDAEGRSSVSWTRDGYVPPVFREGSFGHAGRGGANDGFVRDASVLALVIVTNTEDCSAPNSAFRDPDDPAYSNVYLPLRCFTFPELLYPVQRYVNGLGGLRRNPSRLVYAVLAGTPEAYDGTVHYDSILADERMTARFDPTGGTMRLLPACATDTGPGYPARRFVELAQGLRDLGAQTAVHSVCNRDYSRAFSDIGYSISVAMR